MPNIRKEVGMFSSLGAAVTTFVALPIVPQEAMVATAAVAVGLWVAGVIGLAPYLRQPSSPTKPSR
jgi:hypothetical protein